MKIQTLWEHPFFDRSYKMSLDAIKAICLILLRIEISLASRVLLHNSHDHHTVYCIGKANNNDVINSIG